MEKNYYQTNENPLYNQIKKKKEKTKETYENMTLVPKINPNTNQCNLFLRNKMRFCKFEIMKNSEFCQHHNQNAMMECSQCKHSVLKHKIDKHMKVCKAIKEAERLENTYWHNKNCNLLRQIEEAQDIKTIDNLIKLDVLDQNIDDDSENEDNDKAIEKMSDDVFNEQDIKPFIIKLLNTYDCLSKEYLNYLENHKVFSHIIVKRKLVNDLTLEIKDNKNSTDLALKEEEQQESNNSLNNLNIIENSNGIFNSYIKSEVKLNTDTEYLIKNYIISGISFRNDDLNQTKQFQRLEKHSRQGDAIMSLMENFKLLNSNDSSSKQLFIEFGAGKGGLSEAVIKSTNDKGMYLLLERDGIRYKKDKCSNNALRLRTDILNFDINTLNRLVKEINSQDKPHLKHTSISSNIKNDTNNSNINNDIEKLNFNVIGIAKHICGCALDMSVTCLTNLKKLNNFNFEGSCFASCCHHKELVNNFLGYDKLKDHHSFSSKDFTLLFKSSSWLFESFDAPLNLKYKNIFESTSDKKLIGLISKYVIDLSRCLYLIQQGGKDVLYVKYISNTYTTENNAIVSLGKQELDLITKS